MTDDEIDAAIRAVVPAEYFAKVTVAGTVYQCAIPDAGARAIYRAGMREAARIAREELNIDARDDPLATAGQIAAAIERAAGGER